MRPSASETFRAPVGDVADLPVDAVMTTRVLVTTPDDDILLAWELMIHAGIRHLPVVDGSRLVGLIDDRRLASECMVRPLAARSVRDLVDHPPLRVRRDASLRDVAARMAADRTDAVCVTTPAGDLIGVVTTSDLVRALAGGLPAHREATATTMTPVLFRLTPVLPADS